MKKPIITGIAILLISALAVAQQPLVRPYLKLHMDSIRTMGWAKRDTAAPNLATVPHDRFYGRPRSFEALNPGGRLLQSTARGKVYALPPDNMPVLAPDMTLTEKMPGSSRTYKPAPPSRMPNPLYPQRKQAR